jgi:tetratricopeptide (TPR) repeat protein
MSLLSRLMKGSRVRSARQKLAGTPTATNYVALANEHARNGDLASASRVCEEGLRVFAGNAEIARLYRRTRQLVLEDRTKQLTRELREAPRPALYRELSEILIESGWLRRAEECAVEWHQHNQDPEAHLARAKARLQRFFSDRRREDGKLVGEFLDQAEEGLGEDERIFRLRLHFTTRIGAYKDARRLVGKLLELAPGDQELEARFRSLMSLADASPTIDQALRTVEKTGQLADDAASDGSGPSASSIRPMLNELGDQPGVLAAIYERGSTALVQGTRGATAERMARSVREVVARSRTAARRLGLGQPTEVVLEGEFGSLLVAPGDSGSAAVWCERSIHPRHRKGVRELIGAAEPEDEEERS